MMKGRSKMMTMILSILAVGLVVCLLTGGVIVYLGRSQSLSVKSIENLDEDLYMIHLTKPKNMTWKAGSYANITLPDIEEKGQKSRWLTIASSPDDNEILILTYNSGSLYKKTLVNLPVGSSVEISWPDSHLSVAEGEEPIVCFASDVGIAAMRPVIKEWAGKRPIILNHLDKGVMVFDKEMAELSNQKDNFSYETGDSLSQSQEKLKNAVDEYGNNATYLLAGQPDDIETMKKFLEDKGIDSKQIKVDSFKGLK